MRNKLLIAVGVVLALVIGVFALVKISGTGAGISSSKTAAQTAQTAQAATETATPSPGGSASQTPSPVATETKTETIEKDVPFTTKYVTNARLSEGTEKVITEGKNGRIRVTTTYTVDPATGARKKSGETTETLVQMVQRVVAKGQKSASSTAAAPASARSHGSSSSGYARARAAFDIWNAYRRANGLSEVAWSESLYQHAQQRSVAIVRDFSHRGARNFENIAAGQETADAVMSTWKNSPPHNRNLLHDGYSAGAIALYIDPNSEYVYYWVLVGND